MLRSWAIVFWAGALLLAGAGWPGGAAAAPAALTFTVNNVFDVPADFGSDPGFTVCHTNPTNNICTLRAAIMNANRHAGGATIILPANTYVLTLAPAGADDDATGDLNITGTVSLLGAGAAGTIVDGNALEDVFIIDGGDVTLSGLTIRNGDNGGNGSGGGIDNFGKLTLSDSVVSDNSAGLGGGIYNEQGATLLVRRSTIRDNQAVLNGGGGIESYGALTIENSTINNNQAVVGGGVSSRSPGSLTVVNSTISNNSATGSGGGVIALSPAVFYHTTIAGNLADSDGTGGGYGGGVYGAVVGQVQVWNSLFAFNYMSATDSSCSGAGLTSDDYNLFESTAGCTIGGTAPHDVLGGAGDAVLMALAGNGGATQTRGLLLGSAALDRIPPARCRDQFGAAPVPDQRGVARPVNGLCDMGAFEGTLGRSLFFNNLVLNGDAEAAAGSPTGAWVGTPWWSADDGQFTAVPYNAPGGFPLVGTDAVPSEHGYNFFAGGAATPSSAIQDLVLAPIGGPIDSGGVHFTLSADLGGWTSNNDYATFQVTFQNQNGDPIGSPVVVGPVTAADRGNLTGFQHRSATGLVPVGARFAFLKVSMTAFSGYNDGYADNLSLVLTPAHAVWLPVVRR